MPGVQISMLATRPKADAKKAPSVLTTEDAPR